ncbi:MAG: DUF6036 family nucleotidyltransferase [Actinomycetes bacterium]|jgi:hypothetical protein
MFDPVRICEVLNEEGVRYIIVGGIATVMHGSSLPTQDIDLVPDRSDGNLECLVRALARLNVQIRTGDEPLKATIDEQFLRNSTFMLNLVSDFGDIDLAFQPSGPLLGYEGWKQDAIELSIAEGVTVWVAALNDVVDSKRAANRPKDQAALPYLESLRDQLSD